MPSALPCPAHCLPPRPCSTFGGNPLASAVGIAALEVLEEEHLAQK